MLILLLAHLIFFSHLSLSMVRQRVRKCKAEAIESLLIRGNSVAQPRRTATSWRRKECASSLEEKQARGTEAPLAVVSSRLEVELHLEARVPRGHDAVDIPPSLHAGCRAAAPLDASVRVRERRAVAKRRIGVEHVEDIDADVDSLALKRMFFASLRSTRAMRSP